MSIDLAKDKIYFLLDNLYQATNAIGVSLLGVDNSVIAEIGTVDMELLSKNLNFLFDAADNFSLVCDINNDDYLSLVIKKTKISFLCVRINKCFALICIYPKTVDLNSNLEDIEVIVRKLITNLEDLKKQGT